MSTMLYGILEKIRDGSIKIAIIIEPSLMLEKPMLYYTPKVSLCA